MRRANGIVGGGECVKWHSKDREGRSEQERAHGARTIAHPAAPPSGRAACYSPFLLVSDAAAEGLIREKIFKRRKR